MNETRRDPLYGGILQEIPEVVQIGLKWETHSLKHQQSVRLVSEELQRQGRQTEKEEEAWNNPQNDCVGCLRKRRQETQ